MQISRLCLAASLAAITSVGPAFAAEDVGAGQEIYQAQCSACHSNQPGVNGIGPSLAGVAGRKAGSLPGFHYTPAISGSGLTWDAKTFIQFLADPTKLVPGTAMTVMVPDETGRANLFAYLATLKDTTAQTKPTGPAVPKITGPTQAELDGAAAVDRRLALRLARLCRHAFRRSQSDHAGQRQEPASRLPLPLRAIGLGADEPARLWRGDVSHLRARHRRHRRQDLPRALDLYLAAQGPGDLARQSRRRHQGRQARARHCRRLSHRPRHGRRLASVEPAGRQRRRRSIFLDAAAHLRRPHHRRAFGRRFRRQELGRRLQARDRRAGVEVQSRPRSRRARRRDLGKRRVAQAWRRQPVDAALARRQGRHRLPAGRQSRAGLLRRA